MYSSLQLERFIKAVLSKPMHPETALPAAEGSDTEVVRIKPFKGVKE